MTDTAYSIVDLALTGDLGIEQAASILFESFRQDWPDAWPSPESAREEVLECLEPGKICRAALDEKGKVLGFVGATSQYRGGVFELHPMCVSPSVQGRGLGSAMVADLVERVRDRGGRTIYLGTDDENDLTSASSTDLFDEPWRHIRDLRAKSRHPLEFYRKLGFVVVGLIPDANGPGKPDIMMARKI